MSIPSIEERLRREARARPPAAPPELAARVLAAVAADRQPQRAERPRPGAFAVLAAVALPLAAGLALAMLLPRGPFQPPAPSPAPVAAHPLPVPTSPRGSAHAAEADGADLATLDGELAALGSDLRAGGALIAAALPQPPGAHSGWAR